ncbi:hypothetical protein I8F73_04060 [Enterococcus faecalis]|nr:hypothetical protein [Enterococcus faecalis]
MSILPGLFNINEPMIFGAPVVMNPVLGIPFILAPLVTTDSVLYSHCQWCLRANDGCASCHLRCLRRLLLG